MGLLSYLSMMQDIKVQKLVLVLIFAVSIVSGDVSLQNSYSAGSSETREYIYLHDMDYSNSASISSDSYSASSRASPAEKSNDSNFADIAYMDSIAGPQGAGLEIDADNLGYSRSINGGGESNSIVFSYSAESGILQANYFTPLSTYSEDLFLINNSYRADFGVFNARSYSLGNGWSTVDAQSSFKHNISMTFLNKYNNIKAVLETGEESFGETPVNYTWSGYSSQRDYAVSGINMMVTSGNRTVDFWIDGTSSILEDKSSPDKKNDTYPAHFGNSGGTLNKTLIMQYRLNKTG